MQGQILSDYSGKHVYACDMLALTDHLRSGDTNCQLLATFNAITRSACTSAFHTSDSSVSMLRCACGHQSIRSPL